MKVDNFNLSRWIIHITRGVTWMVLFTPAYRYASAQSGIQQPENANGLYTNLDPSMAIVILVLISTIFIVAIFSLYVRHCSDSSAAVDFSGKGGLDPAVIQTFPIFIYSAVKHLKIGKGALECAVCLSEFVDDDTLRLIPKCEHVFHPDCIDTWLASHVTCPVCRAKLTPEPNQKVKSTESNELNQNQNDSGSEQSEEQNRVVIDINVEQSSSEAQVCEIANTSQVNRPTRLGIPEKLPRSNSTGHLLVQSGVNVERYTMRLPEEVRKQLMMNGKLKRTVSFNTVLAREGSSLKGGYGSGGAEGSSRGRN